jgi:hypothetical protein
LHLFLIELCLLGSHSVLRCKHYPPIS